jgi:ketosteroid isomerase-like protein
MSVTMVTNEDVVPRLLAAIAARDGATVRELVTDDACWWAPRSSEDLDVARPLVGVEAVTGLLGGGHSFVAHVQRGCKTTRGADSDNDSLLTFRFVGGRIAEASDTERGDSAR